MVHLLEQQIKFISKSATLRLILLFIAISTQTSWAGEILTAKGRKVLFSTEQLNDLIINDEVLSKNASGKPTALIKVIQIRGAKAIGDVIKGKAEKGQSVVFRKGRASISRDVRENDLNQDEADESSVEKYRETLRQTYTGKSWGVMAQYLQMSMAASISTGAGALLQRETVRPTGSQFGVVGYYDYPILRNFHFRMVSGLEPYKASGSASFNGCSAGTTNVCDFNVNYFSLHGQAKLNYYESKEWRGWITGGYGILIALSKSSSLIDTSQISPSQVFTFGTGVDIPFQRKYYFPISLEYGLFPKTETVETNVLVLRAGFAWNLR